MNIYDSNNAFKGGITYTSPALYFGGGQTAAPNSGLSFDIPLATVNNMTNTALAFNNANSNSNRDFLGGVFSYAQTSNNMTAAQTVNMFDTALQNQAALAMTQTQQVPSMWQGLLDTSVQLADASRRITNAGNKGMCFITTAVCEAEGKPDDCEELTVLRAFRDDWMAKDEAGLRLIRQYYDEAPAIVAKIKERPDADKIFAIMRHGYIRPAVRAAVEKRNEDALRIYTDLVTYAREVANV